MANPYFVITKSAKSGEFYFNLKAANHEIILTSEGYTAKDGCKNGIESVKKNAADEARFEVKVAKDGQFYFVLKAGNGQTIGRSEMYTTKQSCEKGMASVMKNGPIADTVDKSEA